jgi:SCY1-like protein 2
MNVDYAAIASTLKKGLRDAVSVAAAAAAATASAARSLHEELTQFRGLRGYRLLPGPVATAGPLDCWRIYEAVTVGGGGGGAAAAAAGGGAAGGGRAAATAAAAAAAASTSAVAGSAASAYPVVGVWILDKRALAESLALRGGFGGGGGGFGASSTTTRAADAAALEPALALLRRGAARMARVKHPGVLRVLEPLEETGWQMVLVTEPVHGSLSNLLTGFRAVPGEGGEELRSAAGGAAAASSPDPARSRREQPPLSELEVKYGLAHLAETLQFLNQDARLVHGGVSPRSVAVTRDGGWRLCGFEFCESVAVAAGAAAAAAAGGAAAAADQQLQHQTQQQQQQEQQLVSYDYYSSAPPVESLLSPPLSFTAPELVSGGSGPVGAGIGARAWLVPHCEAGRLTAAADAFSLAALAYEMTTRRRLLPAPEVVGGGRGGGGYSGAGGGSGSDAVASYRSRLAALEAAAAAGAPLGTTTTTGAAAAASLAAANDSSLLPPSLEPTLRAMLLAPCPSSRPPCSSLLLSPFLQDDMLLRALRFLDAALQREPAQKVAFLRDLASLWPRFDDRLLRLRVLPPVVAEMRSSDVVALAALPVVLAIMDGGRLTREDVAGMPSLLAALRGVFEKADGEVQLALVRALPAFQRLLPSDLSDRLLVPLVTRACDNPNPKAQEEVLRGMLRVVPDVAVATLRASLLPKVGAMCLRTTSLAVRVSCLRVLSASVPRLDRAAADAMLQMLAQVVAADKSAGTAMAALALCESVSRAHGAQATALACLPLLCPLLVSGSLSAGQFGTLRQAVRAMVERAGSKREEELGGASAVAAAMEADEAARLQKQQQQAAAAPAAAGGSSSEGIGGGGGGGASAGPTGGSSRSVVAAVSWQQAAVAAGGGGGGSGGIGGSSSSSSADPFALSPPPAAAAPLSLGNNGGAAPAPLDDLFFGQGAGGAASLGLDGFGASAAAADADPFGSLAAAAPAPPPLPPPFLPPPPPPPPKAAAAAKVPGAGGLTGDPFSILAGGGGGGGGGAPAGAAVPADDAFAQLAAAPRTSGGGGGTSGGADSLI